MSGVKEFEDRKNYDQLFTIDLDLWQGLRACDPREVISRCWVEHGEERGYYFPFLNQECFVDPDKESVYLNSVGESREASFQETLVTIMYLLKAKNIPPTGNMITEKDIKGGIQFFQGPHSLMTKTLVDRYQFAAEDFMAKGESIGGMRQEYGDAAIRLRPLPKIPVTYILYKGDEEFKGNVVVAFDETVGEHLPLDVIWALVNVTSSALLDR